MCLALADDDDDVDGFTSIEHLHAQKCCKRKRKNVKKCQLVEPFLSLSVRRVVLPRVQYVYSSRHRVHQCRFMCSDRWSDRENERWHRWQRNGFCPVCFRKWRVSSSDRANFQVQPSHVHWYGFSPARPKRPKKTKQNTNEKKKMNIIGFLSLNKKTNKQDPLTLDGLNKRKRARTCVRSFVSFKVRTLGVDFLAAFKVALVNFAPPQAVGEVADGSGRAGRRRRRVARRRVPVGAQSVVGRRSVRGAGRGGGQRPLTQSPEKKIKQMK